MITAKLLLTILLQSAPISGLQIDNVNIDEAYCLAENIFYEARNEDIQGQFAVASVTMNRVNDPHFPKTICEVVKQSITSKINKKTICAFSWYCDNDIKGIDIPIHKKNGEIDQQVVDQFQVASMIAISSLTEKLKDSTHGATHFHNPFKSQPQWTHTLIKTVRLGNHDFYKFPKVSE